MIDGFDDVIPFLAHRIRMPRTENRTCDGSHRVGIAADVRGEKDGDLSGLHDRPDRESERDDCQRVVGEVPGCDVVRAERGTFGQISMYGA